MGPIEITARGMAKPDGSASDVDRELFVLFSVSGALAASACGRRDCDGESGDGEHEKAASEHGAA
jgi:hypothetical protein